MSGRSTSLPNACDALRPHSTIRTRSGRLAPVVEAFQALRGVPCTVAVTIVGGPGYLSRLDNARQLMSDLGLTPSAYASGERRHQGGLTKAGNAHARRALVAGTWASRDPAKVRRPLQQRLEQVPKCLQDLSWKAHVWLCSWDRHLSARGKRAYQVVVASARDLRAFMGALAQEARRPAERE